MVHRYSVIRYVPDPRNEEFINIGVVVCTDDGLHVAYQFLSHWERAAAFGGVDVTFLKQFAATFTLEPPVLASLQHMAVNWQNSIQVREPHASVAPFLGDLLEQLCSIYLVDR